MPITPEKIESDLLATLEDAIRANGSCPREFCAIVGCDPFSPFVNFSNQFEALMSKSAKACCRKDGWSAASSVWYKCHSFPRFKRVMDDARGRSDSVAEYIQCAPSGSKMVMGRRG